KTRLTKAETRQRLKDEQDAYTHTAFDDMSDAEFAAWFEGFLEVCHELAATAPEIFNYEALLKVALETGMDQGEAEMRAWLLSGCPDLGTGEDAPTDDQDVC